jgi:putative membrane protein
MKENMDNSARINKDLILREKLAIERTAMAIDTTLLSFIRTSLYFAVAGLSVNSLLKMEHGLWLEILFFIFSGMILISGLITYFKQKKKLKDNKKHIGNYVMEWEDDLS